MGKLLITYGDKRHDNGSMMLNNLATNMPDALKLAFAKVGGILAKQISKNLSGESHTRYPNTTNPFPGVLSGTLLGSAGWEPIEPLGVMAGVGGDASKYAGRQEDLYPYVKPAWHEQKALVLKTIFKYVTESTK